MDGDADAGAGDFEVGQVEDFAGFVEHFELFLGVAAVLEDVDVGDDVGGDLVGVDVFGDFAVVGEGLDLGVELGDTGGAGAGDGLVGRGDDVFEAEGLVKRAEGHEGDDGGAVGVGNDALGGVLSVSGVEFGDDEGDVGVHAEGGGVVDDDGTGGGGVRGEFLGDGASGGEEGDIDVGEGMGGEFLDGEFLALERDGFPGRASGCEEGELGEGKFAVGDAGKHFDSDGTGGASDGDVRRVVHERGGTLWERAGDASSGILPAGGRWLFSRKAQSKKRDKPLALLGLTLILGASDGNKPPATNEIIKV